MTYLNELEQKSIFIIREAYSKFHKTALLWSIGKDSTVVLWLIRKAFYGKVPFPVMHIDTSYKFPKMYQFRDELAKGWNLNLLVERNEEALQKGISYETHDAFTCCHELKSITLKKAVDKHEFDALFVGIRRDEHGLRNKERYFSPRDNDFKWNVVKEKEVEKGKEKEWEKEGGKMIEEEKVNRRNSSKEVLGNAVPKNIQYGDSPFIALQDAEFDGIGVYATDFGFKTSHVRVHPLLHWTELDIWQYIQLEGIPVCELYFARNSKRFRSLGCMPITEPITSEADTVEKIIEELKQLKTRERAGRKQDKEDEYTMQKLRSLGYM